MPRSDLGIPRPHRRILLSERLENKSMYCGDCIIWVGAVGRCGYGSIGLGGINKDGNAPTILAHRAAYLIRYGSLPNGLELDHLCRNKLCVNPGHLEAVTKSTNIRRGFANRPIKNHCKYGHLYMDETIYRRRDGGRSCKACRRKGGVRFYGKK